MQQNLKITCLSDVYNSLVGRYFTPNSYAVDVNLKKNNLLLALTGFTCLSKLVAIVNSQVSDE